jgi:hypothetical protein
LEAGGLAKGAHHTRSFCESLWRGVARRIGNPGCGEAIPSQAA